MTGCMQTTPQGGGGCRRREVAGHDGVLTAVARWLGGSIAGAGEAGWRLRAAAGRGRIGEGQIGRGRANRNRKI